jgi:predicted dehydrogenase
MNGNTLKWGFLSTARINQALIEPLRFSERNSLVAVASRSQEKADAYAKEWGIPLSYGSYEQLLADPQIDVVYISLPNHLHAEWSIKAAKAGKHVLCEKPLALSLEEVDAIEAAINASGTVLAEAFMYRHHPQMNLLSQLIKDGKIGKLQMILGTFSFYLDRPGDIRLDPEMGGGSIWDVGCYPISFARTIASSEPEQVFGWQVSSDSGVDLIFNGQMRFPEDVFAQFDSSFRSPFRTHVEIVGTDGVIYIANPFKPEHDEVVILHTSTGMEEISVPDQSLYIGEIEDISNAVLDGGTTLINLQDSRANTAAILALLKSAREGAPVHIANL